MADNQDDEELIFDDRRNRRVKVLLTGIIHHGGERYPAKVVDLSAGGCRLVADVDFAVGMPVHVEIGQYGRFPAVVIWVEGKTIGLGFAESIGQTLARLGPSAEALGLLRPVTDEDDGDTGPAEVIDPT